ncbi:MAG: DUF3501 family protein [Acidobacteriota bacterium]
MKKLSVDEILSNEDYAAKRDAMRAEVLTVKNRRRIHVGRHLTFLFETTDTMRYQVQEMLRIEGKDRPEDVAHEVETFNEVLGETGQLGCTLLIEIEDEAERDEKLSAWLELPQHLFLELEDGRRMPAIYDERQVGDDRLSSVQYLKFDCDGGRPTALGSTLMAHTVRKELSEDQAAALCEDLQ